MFATHFVSECRYFTEYSQRVHSVYVTYSQNKSMVFGVQKYGICVAKSRYLRCKSMFFRGCRVYIAICSQRCCRPSAALSQSVSSCRGPIYRARIYVNTHEMGRGNACAVMWKCIFGNGICVFVYVRIRAR